MTTPLKTRTPERDSNANANDVAPPTGQGRGGLALQLRTLDYEQGAALLAPAQDGQAVQLKSDPESEVEEVCEPTPDVSADYAVFDNAIGKAETLANTYLQSASNQVQNMLLSYTSAVNRFQTQLNSKDAQASVDSLAVEIFFSVLSAAVPLAGPMTGALARVASKEFYAAALPLAIDIVKEATKTWVEYTGPTGAKVGDVSSVDGLIRSAISVNEQENHVRKALFTTLRDGWAANVGSAAPEPWTLDIECIAGQAFAPVGEVVVEDWSKSLEEMLWRDYIAKNVQWTFNYPVFSDHNRGFNGLSADTMCYLLERYGWQPFEVAHMATPIEQGFIRDGGETQIPEGQGDPGERLAEYEYCQDNYWKE